MQKCKSEYGAVAPAIAALADVMVEVVEVMKMVVMVGVVVMVVVMGAAVVVVWWW